MATQQEDIQDIKKLLIRQEEREEKEKSKPFKIPFGKRVGKAQAKKNYVTVIKANENGQGQFVKLPIEEQTVMLDGIPRLATPEYIIQYKNNPIMIIPSWSVQPINWKKNHEESLLNGSNTAGYKILMNAMKLNTVDGGKKKMAGWVGWVIGLIVLGIIGYALFTGGAK